MRLDFAQRPGEELVEPVHPIQCPLAEATSPRPSIESSVMPGVTGAHMSHRRAVDGLGCRRPGCRSAMGTGGWSDAAGPGGPGRCMTAGHQPCAAAGHRQRPDTRADRPARHRPGHRDPGHRVLLPRRAMLRRGRIRRTRRHQPSQARSGRTIRYRLNRGADRALNRAIHTIAVTRMRCCSLPRPTSPAAELKATPTRRSCAV
jgi:hypothetical protein